MTGAQSTDESEEESPEGGVHLPGERVDEMDPLDEEISQIWVKAHMVGLLCLCMGMAITSRVQSRLETVASAGWLRGWGWGFCAGGIAFLVASVIVLSQWPEESKGVGAALLLLGTFMLLTGPVILYNGNAKIIKFLTMEANAIYEFPKGCDVQVIDISPDEPNEIDPIALATGTVMGHLKGRVAVKLHDKFNRYLMSNVQQRLPKDGCLSCDVLILPYHLVRIKKIEAPNLQIPSYKVAGVDPDFV